MSKLYVRGFFLLLAAVMLISASACGGKESGVYDLNDHAFTLSQLSGKDALGREISPAGASAEKKYVGVYYFPWFDRIHYDNVYDISEIMAKYEKSVGDPTNPLWALDGAYYDPSVSPVGAFHYWQEPLFGYYRSSDPWIVRRHLELLSYAQVDFIMMDFTNGVIYSETTIALLDAIREMLSQGISVPRMAFMLPNNEKSPDTLDELWEKVLCKGEYADCFFAADEEMNPSGNPLVTGDFSRVTDQTILANIWAKGMFWAYSTENKDYFPAGDIRIRQGNFNGMMAVNVGINTSWFSDCYLYPDATSVYGRGWTPDDPWAQGTGTENVAAGTLFQYQFDYAVSQDVDLIFISCWNEWAAQKQSSLTNDYQTSRKAVFVDTFSEAFSKDIEPAKGPLGDNYYMQLVSLVRKFKGEKTSAAGHGRYTVDLSAGMEAWEEIPGNYLDPEGDAVIRDYPGTDPAVTYRDDTARNDIVRLKFANDEHTFYAMIETAREITPYEAGDASWMNLYLECGGEGMNGYDFVVQRDGDEMKLYAVAADGTKTVKGAVAWRCEGNRLFLSLPLSGLGVGAEEEIGVKATDHIQAFGDAMDFYVSGDSAPIGRLNYAYRVA